MRLGGARAVLRALAAPAPGQQPHPTQRAHPCTNQSTVPRTRSGRFSFALQPRSAAQTAAMDVIEQVLAAAEARLRRAAPSDERGKAQVLVDALGELEQRGRRVLHLSGGAGGGAAALENDMRVAVATSRVSVLAERWGEAGCSKHPIGCMPELCCDCFRRRPHAPAPASLPPLLPHRFGVTEAFHKALEEQHFANLAQRWGSGIDGAPLARLTCANVDVHARRTCTGAAAFVCSGCRLVAYCSRDCQLQHRGAHKADCKSHLAAEGWMPAWLREQRPPLYVRDDEPR